MREKLALYLATGAQEFWVVDPKLKTLSVTGQSGVTTLYQGDDRIHLILFDGEIALTDLFA